MYACMTNCLLQFNGNGGFRGRLGHPVFARDYLDNSRNESLNICVFVAYSSAKSLSTISYLKALQAAGFEILFINNLPTSAAYLDELSEICWAIYDRKNIGRDIGAFKDAVLYLFEDDWLDKCSSLCLANDSMQFVPGVYGERFVERIRVFLGGSRSALFVHQSHQVAKHYQSYFQILKSSVFRSSKFINFWRQYRPLSHRAHCIHNGEIALSVNVYNHIPDVELLCSGDRLIDVLNREVLEGRILVVADLLSLMPSATNTIESGTINYALNALISHKDCQLNAYLLNYFAELIECSNPSHAGAFVYPVSLYLPLIKHDLALAGSFTVSQAVHLFRQLLLNAGLKNLIEIEERVFEFSSMLMRKGIPSDFRHAPVRRALSGVTSSFVYGRMGD